MILAAQVAGGETSFVAEMNALGMFDDAEGLLQVTGSGLAAGQKVVVSST